MSAPAPLPPWADLVVVPALNLALAFLVAGLVVAGIGADPVAAGRALLAGSLGSSGGIGFTLYYATDFIFTGLAVAVAFRAGLFNIGAEGQAYVAGLGVAAVCLGLPGLPAVAMVPLAVLGAAVAGAAWAFVPGWLQARRGSHIVITTIMFNWLSTTLMGYLLVNVLREPTSMQPETRFFPAAAHLATMREAFGAFGVTVGASPLNASFPLALACAVAVWVLIWRTRPGYAIRVVGANPSAALYGGIDPGRVAIGAMLLSGALAGGVAVNEIMGAQDRLLLDFVNGAGFAGIAVALMGRGHPVGVVLAGLLFGVLYQGGAELAFDEPKVTRDMIVVIQGLVVLFAGALEGLFRRPLAALLARRGGRLDSRAPG